jgi:hypothetical protein
MSSSRFFSRFLSTTFLLGAPALVSAGTLQLSAGSTLDISGLNITSVGDMTFADGRIWIADGTTGGLVYAINTSGTLLNTISPTIVPGLSNGPDAMCAIGATGLIVFSSFGQSVAGRFTWTDSTLDVTYPSAEQATGAEFGGGLWIASGTTAGVGSVLKQMDSVTGAVLATIPIPGLTVRIVDLARDPFTGGMYALCEDDQLREIDTVTGAILSTQDLAPLLIGHLSVAGGMDFDSTGAKLYIANGSGAGSDTVVVLNREFSTNVCGTGIGTFACPCANTGATGRGCRNSTNFSLGAFLGTTGIPRVGADSFLLQAASMPAGTFVLFFQATAASAPAFFGDGTLCVGGTIVRLAVVAAPSGTGSYPGAGDPLIHVQGQIPASTTTRFYQGWYRDAGTFCTASTFNLTNAVAAEWRP